MKRFSKAFNKEKIKPYLGSLSVAELQAVFNLGNRLQFLLSRISLVFGGLVLVGGISGANWGVTYVRAELLPKILHHLAEGLDRPIQLGAVERVSWTGVRFGRSSIPATATDADQITADAIEISFNPIHALKNQQLKLTVTLIRPTAYFDQDTAGDWLNVELVFDDTEQIEIEQICLQDATVTLAPQPVTLDTSPPEPDDHPWDISGRPTQITLQHVDAGFSLQNDGQRLVFNFAGEPHQHGKLSLKGDLRFDLEQFKLAVQTQDLQIKSLMPFVPTDLKLEDGVLNADVNLQIQSNQAPTASGTAKLQNGAMRAKGEPNPFTDLNGQFQFVGEEVTLKQGRLRFGQIPFELVGKIHLRHGFDLNAKVEQVEAAPFMQTLQLEVPFPVAGALKSDDLHLTGSFDHPVLAGTAQAAKPIQMDRVKIAAVEGKFSLDLADDHLWLHRIQFQPVTGGTVTTQAEVWLEEDNAKINVVAKNLPADQLAQLYQFTLPNRKLGEINAEAQITVVDEKPSLTANWSLKQGDYPTTGKIAFANHVLTQDATVQIGAGTLNAKGNIQQGRWQANITGDHIPLNQLKPELPGQLQGQLQLSGSLKDFNVATINAKGQAAVQIDRGTIAANLAADQGRWTADVTGSQVPLNQFAEILPGDASGNIKLNGSLADPSIRETTAAGTLDLNRIAFLDQPLTAKFDWNGEKLQLQQAGTKNININGWVIPAMYDNQLSSVQSINLNVNVQDYDLSTSPITKALPIPVTGLVNLKGTVAGSPANPQINSEMQVDNLTVQDFRFEPQLRGSIQSQANHHLSLAGKQDRFSVVFDSRYRPTALSLQLGQAKAEAQLSGDRLLAQIRNFSLEKLNITPVAALGAVRGTLAGNLEVDLADAKQPTVKAAVDIARPGIGTINAATHPDHENDRFTGNLYYQNGAIALTGGELSVGNSHYQLAGQANPKTAEWTSQIVTNQGTFQDLLSTLSPQELAVLIQRFNIMPVNSGSANLAAPVDLTLPTLADLATLKGAFSGSVALQNSAQAGMRAQVNLQGQNWQLANYGIRQMMIANAQFDGQTLQLPTVQAEGFTLALAGKSQPIDARLGFAGQVSPSAIAGQLQLDGIALAQVQNVLNLPVQLNGRVNAVADVSGTPTQPNLNGKLHLSEVQVRDMAIQAAEIGFSYIDQQFYLESWQSPEAAHTN